MFRKQYLGTLSTRDEGFANIFYLENRGSLNVIPILLGKGIGSANSYKNETHISIEKLIQLTKRRNMSQRIEMEDTNAFFLPPFFPLEMRLFFPTAMAHCVRCE